MLGVYDKVLYIGKAKNLKKRLSSYFHNQQTSKVIRLISQLERIEITVTSTEREALLIENNLIKSLSPKYNILFKDDKSYPYIFLSADKYPQLCFYRDKKKTAKGTYFGPFSSSQNVDKILGILQKHYKLRHCSNIFFANRSRPCLQYQIKRCSAPCTGKITEKDYMDNVKQLTTILNGRESSVLEKNIIKNMDNASKNLAYEEAAMYRDQLSCLRAVQAEQQISIVNNIVNIDFIACGISGDFSCLHRLVIRDDKVINSQQFLQVLSKYVASSPQEILVAFLTQNYLDLIEKNAREIIFYPDLEGYEFLKQIFIEKNIILHSPKQINKQYKKWLDMAINSVDEVLKTKFKKTNHYVLGLISLKNYCKLSELPEIIHCFDISHNFGDATVGVCVEFDKLGTNKNHYRKYNIKLAAKSDDYAALKEALIRHYTYLKKSDLAMPNILLIDGGKGQLQQAVVALAELQITNIYIISIAKGPKRRIGEEKLFIKDAPFNLIIPPQDPAFHLLQRVRDEAHRFAITGHRQKRQKNFKRSILENIPGIGKEKKKALLTFFGGLQEIKAASVESLCKVRGINSKLAQQIYNFFHEY